VRLPRMPDGSLLPSGRPRTPAWRP
jgi:hypothetical protein